ncbi:MAG: phosphomannomutase/phosphoglucomutase [Candidatus Paceibacterota bacterium]
MKVDSSIFKAYDIRGIFGTDITPELAYVIGRAYARVILPVPKKIAVGRDVRTHGEVLLSALIKGLQDEGVSVTSLGVISTDMLYFAVAKYGFGGGITVSASHNPQEYNGFKMVRKDAIPVSGDTGIKEIQKEVELLLDKGVAIPSDLNTAEPDDVLSNLTDAYIQELMEIVPIDASKATRRYTFAFNANHGRAGEVVKELIRKNNLPIDIVPLYMEVNGLFPQGRPDPMYKENRDSFAEVIVNSNAEIGVAWDADADRCFFFDHEGNCVDGYHTTALLSDMVLTECKEDNVCIVHDPRLVWAVTNVADKHNARALQNKVGHSYIKERMRKENAIFGGENSGHYYFKDFYYADNGMIPFMLLFKRLLADNVSLKDLVQPFRDAYPISGEINLTVTDIDRALDAVRVFYHDAEYETVDGISIAYPEWRANIRASNTEPILRVNLEAKTSELVSKKTAELIRVLEPYCR